ncbi:MAG TPA: MFS transporter [Pirellulales bacterium]|nr:MFS transporter [Pirellulales bacterium]
MKSPSTAERPTNVRWVVFALACLTSGTLYLHRYSWGVIKSDLRQEFQLSDQQLGWLDSAFQIAYTACQLPTGAAGDRFGPAAVLPLTALAWSIALGATAMGQGFWSFAALRLGFGATQAGAYPNLNKITRSWFPPGVRTTVQGLVGVTAGRVGGACAPLAVATLLMHRFGLGWQTSLLAIALAGVLLAAALRTILRDSPQQHPRANAAERQLIGDHDRPQGEPAEAAGRYSPAVVASLALMMLQSFTSTFADILFVYWIPMFLEDAKGLDKGAMGVFASLPLVAGALGGAAGGALNDLVIRRTGKLRLARSAVGFSGKFTAALLIAASLSVESGRWMMVVVAAAKFFTDWSLPTLWGAVTDIGGRASGKVFGMVNSVGALGGFVAGPAIGAIKHEYGWPPVFWLIAAVYVASALCWLGIDPTRPLDATDPPAG